MHTIPLILSAILTAALVVIIAPNIFAMNRGNSLRNIAIWLAVFAVLGLIYQYFGPNSAHPLFNQPDALKQMQPMAIPDKGGETKPDAAHDYAPPKEE